MSESLENELTDYLLRGTFKHQMKDLALQILLKRHSKPFRYEPELLQIIKQEFKGSNHFRAHFAIMLNYIELVVLNNDNDPVILR